MMMTLLMKYDKIGIVSPSIFQRDAAGMRCNIITRYSNMCVLGLFSFKMSPAGNSPFLRVLGSTGPLLSAPSQ